jgi:hypothetical protein
MFKKKSTESKSCSTMSLHSKINFENAKFLLMLALVLLTISAVLLIKGSSANAQGDTVCTANGGKCMNSDNPCSRNYPVTSSWSCNEDQKCCISVK